MVRLPRYVVLYDGACRFCTAQARSLARFDGDRRLALVDLNAPEARGRYPQIRMEDAQRWMHLVGPDGRTWRGADAVRQLLLLLPPGRPLGALLYLPGVMRLARPLYDWFARNRYRFGRFTADECESGACAVHLGLGAGRANAWADRTVES